MYRITISPKGVAVCVDTPELELDEEQAKVLENRLHDAVEGALAPYWRGNLESGVSLEGPRR